MTWGGDLDIEWVQCPNKEPHLIHDVECDKLLVFTCRGVRKPDDEGADNRP